MICLLQYSLTSSTISWNLLDCITETELLVCGILYSKATSLDGTFPPAWIGYGNAYAAKDEGDQAMSAYRTAARLFPGYCTVKLEDSFLNALLLNCILPLNSIWKSIFRLRFQLYRHEFYFVFNMLVIFLVFSKISINSLFVYKYNCSFILSFI